MVSVNLAADVASYLNGLSLIASPIGEAFAPDDLTEYISLYPYSGLPPVYVHSHGNLPAQEQPGMQIRAGAPTVERVIELIYAAWFATQQVVNMPLGGTQYIGIMANASPFSLEIDAQKRHVWVANMRVIREAPHG